MKEITKEFLIDFEREVHDTYARGEILGPVHLSCGNEDDLINIFKSVKEDDWVFSTWRSHYHAILKSKDPEWVKKEIFEGRSIHINSKKHKIFTSAIVGGILPIALGVALANKRANNREMVWCFIGDMTATLGICSECVRYAKGFDLPITFVIEHNGMSCYTPTALTWNSGDLFLSERSNSKVLIYYYEREPYPHHGIGQWIEFKEKKHWGPAF